MLILIKSFSLSHKHIQTSKHVQSHYTQNTATKCLENTNKNWCMKIKVKLVKIIANQLLYELVNIYKS